MQPHLETRNVHGTQQLALVLVKTLDLHVDHGVGVELEVVVALGKPGKAQLVFVLDLVHAGADGLIVGKGG